jgi:hypothetical protein
LSSTFKRSANWSWETSCIRCEAATWLVCSDATHNKKTKKVFVACYV